MGKKYGIIVYGEKGQTFGQACDHLTNQCIDDACKIITKYPERNFIVYMATCVPDKPWAMSFQKTMAKTFWGKAKLAASRDATRLEVKLSSLNRWTSYAQLETMMFTLRQDSIEDLYIASHWSKFLFLYNMWSVKFPHIKVHRLIFLRAIIGDCLKKLMKKDVQPFAMPQRTSSPV